VNPTLTQLPHRKKKYDSKSKHCGVRPDLGTTPAEADQGFFEVRRAKINGAALIFGVRPCELRLLNNHGSTSVSSRSIRNALGKGRDF
jgi:hypothetical protein